jgi:prepilin-type N-terminal cleavage/methylation domain-containing protein
MLQAHLRRLREARAAEVEGEEIAEGGFTLIELMVVLLIIAILLAIAIPTFLGVTNTAGDRAAQSNLTNALTEAKALYEVTQSYSSGGAYTPAVFTSQAPEFTWTQNAACAASATNCISYEVVNASTTGDGQGLVLAAYSAKTSTCWYALDLESAPAVTTGAGALITSAGGSATDENALNATVNVTSSLANAGVFYGKSTPNTTSCSAATGASPTSKALWNSSYSNAGTVS